MRIGLIACQGQLPLSVHQQLCDQGHHVKIVSFKEFTSDLQPDFTCSLGQIGRIIHFFKKNEIQHIMFAGRVSRPDLWQLRFDFSGLRLAWYLLPFLKKGDDQLLRAICNFLEKRALKLVSISSLCPKLMMPEGCLTHKNPQQEIYQSIDYGKKILNMLAPFDIGQSIAVAAQIVLGIESLEGTDQMIQNIRQIAPMRLRGLPAPIFIKMRKKNQSDLMDLPTLGLRTIENLVASGFKTAAFEAGGCVVIDLDAVINYANQHDFCIIGICND